MTLEGSASASRLALSPLGFLELDPPAFIELAASVGFDAVAIRMRAASPGGVDHPFAAGSALARATIAAVRATGVTVDHVEVLTLDGGDVWPHEPLLEAAAEVGARRVLVTGDHPDRSLLADRLAALCAVASGFGQVVDLEFMPFRHVATLADAVAVVEAAGGGATGARVLVDALHLARSGGSPGDVAAVARALLGACHLCDAPAVAPPDDRLADEARGNRFLPGEGGLPLAALVEAMPSGTPFVAEVPLGGARGQLTAPERALAVSQATAALLRSAIG